MFVVVTRMRSMKAMFSIKKFIHLLFYGPKNDMTGENRAHNTHYAKLSKTKGKMKMYIRI